MSKAIFIADDHPTVLKALRNTFTSDPQFVVCAEADNGQDAIEKASMLHPDLILLDVSMPIMNGLEAARILRQRMPMVPIVMFTAYKTRFLVAEAFAAGAGAVVSKEDDIETLINRARILTAGTATN